MKFGQENLMISIASGDNSTQKTGLPAALQLIDELGEIRNVPRSAAIAVFVISGAMGVYGFFLINDLALWDGISTYTAASIISISWVLIFPMWILSFLVIMTALDFIGFKDVRALAKNNLTKMDLSQRELQKLDEVLIAGEWNHGDILKGVVGELKGKYPSQK